MNTSLSPRTVGIFLGVAYGILIRVLWELDELKNVGELVTISFMFLLPMVIGYIRVHFELKVIPELTKRKAIVIAWQPIFVFLLASVVTLLEGSICVAIALPAFMFFASIGGVIAIYLNRIFRKRKQQTLLSVAFLPILLAPVELNFLHLSKTYEVSNSIVIAAPASVVWSQLANVEPIKADEWSCSLTQLIGVPKPIAANMVVGDGDMVGAVRTSTWQKGVEFNEIITRWQPNKALLYRFDIDPNRIPDHALDKHVKLGGEYFSPLFGGYEIAEDGQGNTILHLKTTLMDNTNFGFYSRIWGELIFQDFHQSLLHLMKQRAERISHPARTNPEQSLAEQFCLS